MAVSRKVHQLAEEHRGDRAQRPQRRLARRVSTTDPRAPASVCSSNLGRIVDLSATGMQIATKRALRRGERCKIRCSAADAFTAKPPIEAEVIWCGGGRAGLRFCSPLTATSRLRHVLRYWCRNASAEVIRSWIEALCIA